jgi:hypothetical protein
MYKQNPNSPVLKALKGNQPNLNAGLKAAIEAAPESPARQTTAGEFAHKQSIKDKEMGKSTKAVDKFKAAYDAMTTDKTYAEAKKGYRKAAKEEYEANNPESPAKQAKRVTPSELNKSSYTQNAFDPTRWSYTEAPEKSTPEPHNAVTAPQYRRSNTSNAELASMPSARRLDTIRAQENAGFMASKGVAGIETMSNKDVNKMAKKHGYSNFTQQKVKERFSSVSSKKLSK